MALPTTVRDDALNLSTDLAQAGAVFNDATRLADGGLWSSPADDNNQPAYLGMYTTDIHAVSNDIAAILADPAAMTIGGTAYAINDRYGDFDRDRQPTSNASRLCSAFKPFQDAPPCRRAGRERGLQQIAAGRGFPIEHLA